MSAAVLAFLAVGCAGDAAPRPTNADGPVGAPAPFDATSYVDPFIGTGGHGHTFPGATVPFGMVQLSPDTRLEGWDGCSGYHHDDEYVYGFSHTHLSGTGCSDYGDILLMPSLRDGNGQPDGEEVKTASRQHFSHANETASAGYYSVLLDDSKVKVELTATTRVGVHRYTYPAGARDARVLVDLAHRDKVIESSMTVVGDREVRGFRRSRAWAQDQRVYFVAQFSKPIAEREWLLFTGDSPDPPRELSSVDGVRASFRFDCSDGAPLVVKVGISAVDCDGAAKNLDAEMPGFDFDAARSAALANWRSQLGKIEVHGGTDAQLRTFYSALYHCCIAPNVFSDVDGRYRGRDMKIHEAKGWTQYTVFSLWDTFRALHPLMTILEPARTNDWINTFLAQYREGGALPVWELAANETDCMIGYHAVPVIADAYMKGIRGYDANAALDAMVASANRDVRGLKAYREQGFVPSDEEGESVSKTLEYAYDDACIATMAQEMKQHELADEFAERSASWMNLFDPETGFFRPRRNNTWVEPFDPAEVNNHLTEANSWQYSLFVPQDNEELTSLLGGRDGLASRLDAMFSAPSATKGRDQADITGLIGQYAHGNEPSHHMAYLYDYAFQPWKTQQRVRQIVDTLYSDKPDGLCGNEDCGQMSAWYVFSALGFYPVTPGAAEYAVGTPVFPEATIHLDNGRSFAIRASGEGPYIGRIALGAGPLSYPKLEHADLLRGGVLDVTLSSSPSFLWNQHELRPPSRWNFQEWRSVPVPFVARGDRVFARTTELVLGDVDPNVDIHVSLDAGKTFQLHAKAIPIETTTEFVCYASRREVMPNRDNTVFHGYITRESKRAHARFVKLPHAWTLTLAHPYAPQYAANGPTTLIDGLRGGRDFRTGDWQGFQGVDVDATIDLGAERAVSAVRVGFLQDTRSWIWMPTEVRVSVSRDGRTFDEIGALENNVDERSESVEPLVFQVNANARARFVRVVGRNRGVCPDWHPGAGHKAWLFADEIGIDAGD